MNNIPAKIPSKYKLKNNGIIMVHAQQQKMATNTRFDSLKDDVSSTRGHPGSRRHGRRRDNNHKSSNHKSSNHKSKGVNQSQTHLKKKSSSVEFSMNSSAFPKLSKSSDTKPTAISTMDFASAAKPEEQVTIVDEVDPGWVKIRRNSSNNKIVYQYNRNHPTKVASIVSPSPQEDTQSSKGLDETQEDALYFLTKRWQGYRDEQNTQYPETSPFMDTKSLLEDLSDDCYETESEPESESDISVYDSDEYHDDEF